MRGPQKNYLQYRRQKGPNQFLMWKRAHRKKTEGAFLEQDSLRIVSGLVFDENALTHNGVFTCRCCCCPFLDVLGGDLPLQGHALGDGAAEGERPQPGGRVAIIIPEDWETSTPFLLQGEVVGGDVILVSSPLRWREQVCCCCCCCCCCLLLCS